MSIKDSDFYSSLKSIETENKIDIWFYRPLAYQIAKRLQHTGITPNMVTIFSIFVGVMAAIMFYFPTPIIYPIIGILLLITANTLDCVDGQLARLTGIKSEIGRILDGFAGDVWFACVYIAIALRTVESGIEIPVWGVIIMMLLSAFSHMNQARLTDYYKTLHLFFVSKDKGKEFETSDSIAKRRENMAPGVNRFFTFFYIRYTRKQESWTPKLQLFLKTLSDKYPDREIPEDLRLSFRKKSRKIMNMVDLLTFNGRSILLFILVLTPFPWLYYVWEFIFLNIVLLISRSRHEKMCSDFNKQLK